MIMTVSETAKAIKKTATRVRKKARKTRAWIRRSFRTEARVTKRSPISIERGHIHKSMQLKFLSICDLISISTY
jgi:DNA-binding XRE family transcriptional regulator